MLIVTSPTPIGIFNDVIVLQAGIKYGVWRRWFCRRIFGIGLRLWAIPSTF
jgi:hypothetical protein